jgi:ElaB/YqjD/DUF883 family membrane-anchored ribosome-binding protein
MTSKEINMEKDPDAIRQDIEATRERMGDTVEALAYKADVPARTKDAVHDKIESVKNAVSDVVDATTAKLTGVAHDTQAKVAGVVDDAQPHVEKLRDNVGSVTAGARDAAMDVRDKLPDGNDARVALSNAKGIMQDNPLGLAIGSIAVGLLLGSLLPVSTIERKQIGPIGEKLTDGAKAAASDLVDQGKAAVTQAVSDAFSAKTPKPQSSS